ncbi:MAG: hypothetical protein Q4E65_05685 [Clostridia bacterium]|nr:hypothetical protein [Clostridia bacterium]
MEIQENRVQEKTQTRAGYPQRIARLLLGLVLFSIGSYLTIQANIGLAPWEAFSMGVSTATGTSYGNILVLSGFVILLIDIVLKEKIGFGTVLDMLLIGKFVDLWRWMELVPMMDRFLPGLGLLLLGQVCICVASCFYIGAGFSCGPRDALMVALGKRFPKTPIGLIRGLIEGSVLLVGWLLGAKVGIGTVIAVFGIGFILQLTFKLLRFDVTAVVQEDLLQTVRGMRKEIAAAEK